MTNAELIATIRAEIERQQKENINYDENGGFASYCDFSAWSALDSILTFVSCLEESEKPIIPITVTVLDNDLNPVEITANEKPMNQENSHEAEVNAALRKIDEEFLKQLSEKPMNQKELEKEIEEYFPESAFNTGFNYDDLQEIARHFAQWGAEHLKK